MSRGVIQRSASAHRLNRSLALAWAERGSRNALANRFDFRLRLAGDFVDRDDDLARPGARLLDILDLGRPGR